MKENLLKKSEEQNLQICDFSIKNIYIDRLDDKVEKVSNKYQKIVKMNPIDVKSSIYIDHSVEKNDCTVNTCY